MCVICYDKYSTSQALNRHLLICNSITKEVYPSPQTFISFDDKKAAKFASPLSIIGFADFEAKLDSLDYDNNKDQKAFDSNKSFTIRLKSLQINACICLRCTSVMDVTNNYTTNRNLFLKFNRSVN